MILHRRFMTALGSMRHPLCWHHTGEAALARPLEPSYFMYAVKCCKDREIIPNTPFSAGGDGRNPAKSSTQRDWFSVRNAGGVAG